MTEREANNTHKGTIVIYGGKRCRVNSVKTTGISSPFFRLSFEDTGEGVENGSLISYKLCSLPK